MPSSKSNRKIRALVLSHTSDITGGAELSMLDVFDSLSINYNVEPIFIIREPIKAMAHALKKRGWRYHALRYNFWSERDLPKDSFGILKAASINNPAIRLIEDIIQKEKPDVVITNSVICPWAAIAAYLQKAPHIWFVREYGDLDHGRDFLLSTRQTFETVASLSQLVVANSLTLETYLKEFVPHEKLTTLYTPFDLSLIKVRSEESIASPFNLPHSLRLCSVAGSVVKTKGQLDIVKAIGQLHQAGHEIELCIVGHTDNKSYYQEILTEIRRYRLDEHVHFVGFQANPLPFMALADVGIMTSRMEAFGRVTFEYLALGKAVVGADSGATPEMVVSGKNGFLFAPGNINDLANQIGNYTKNPELIELHGVASRKRAHSMMSQAQNIDAFYQRLEQLTVVADARVQDVPIHLIHHWLDYPRLALQVNGVFGQMTGRRLKAAAKDVVRPAYNKARGLKARLTGK